MCDAYASRWHGSSSAMDDAVDAKRHCGASCIGIRFAAAVTRMGDRSGMWVWQWRRDIAVEEQTMAEAAIRSERTVQHPSRGSDSRESRLGSRKDGRCTSAYRQSSMFRRVCKKSSVLQEHAPRHYVASHSYPPHIRSISVLPDQVTHGPMDSRGP